MTVLDTTIRGGVMTITLDDQPRRNALSTQLLRELLGAIDGAENDPGVRVVVVTNRGSTFCAGADLAERSNAAAVEEDDVVEMSEIFRRIRCSPKPFVGRLAGHCVAGGVGLAAVMDISIAIDTATFGFTEVRLGVAPAIISIVCLPKMRIADAKDAFLRGNRFPAAQAVRMGLVNAAVPENELDDAIHDVVRDLLAGEPRALAVAKQLALAVTSMPEGDAIAWTNQLSTELFQSDEAREGIRAYLEKRPAAWVRDVATDSS
jgi:methylglutaconyl-CoA hydratase